VGDLRIEESRDTELRRYVRTAKLLCEDAILYSAELPELRDVRVISGSPQAFTLAGFERVDGARVRAVVARADSRATMADA